MKLALRWAFFTVGIIIFSFGITMAINVRHLGIHPWDVLNVALSNRFGFTIGFWTIIVSSFLIIVSFILDRSYIKLGTFVNGLCVGLLVDFYMWLDILPEPSHTWTDIFMMVAGITVMGIGGGVYNAGGVGSGPRDGFMLSISDKTGLSVRGVRIIVETFVLLIGFLLGGPVFIFTFLFTFIQSPIFQQSYFVSIRFIERAEMGIDEKCQMRNKQRTG